MPYILLGSLAFLLFMIYDVNSITAKCRLLQSGFFLGCILLIAATSGLLASVWAETAWGAARTTIFIALAILFLLLLIYTLFFAIPFKGTYIKPDLEPETCTTGFYALCRHPGVLCFMGFYFSLWLAFSGALLLLATILFSLLNLCYIILQDRWVFMRTFADYGDYKKLTPFLIPNYQSIKRCFSRKKGRHSEI